jgi:Rps23 Pro-64 3,4-dihydroxylase Tpa1-like proline 4-hydroxylase
VRNDLVISLSVLQPDDKPPPFLGHFLSQLDQTVRALQLSPTLGKTSIAPSLLREEMQATCYPAGSEGYERHVDDPHGDRGRVLTAILYLNPHWKAGQGGELRLHLDGEHDSAPIDVDPLDGRLVLFFSDARVPHQVMPAVADRYAISIWYSDGQKAAAAASFINRKHI